MRPTGAVAVDFGPSDDEPSRTSDDFEQVPYPHTHWSASHHEEELPLYSMNEEKARRRVPKPAGPLEPVADHDHNGHEMYDDEGKDVYNKLRTVKPFQSSGRQRFPHAPPPTSIKEFLLQNLEHITPVVYTLLSCWTRFHKIGHSNIVVWDEAHFGKFGSHYLKREFYFDVHPPLGKMLVGLVGLLAGYDGSFEFKSGEAYPDTVPYVAMRVMLATFGVGMVPLGCQWACHLVALMVLFDVGWLCISRFILLDSMLLFFTFLTVFCMTKFHNQHYQPFSFDWWTWLFMTGFSIGLVTSVKMVGLFVTALVGLYTIEDLWEKFGDLKMPVRDQIKHWTARVVCLIIVPFLVFMASFKIHFMVPQPFRPRRRSNELTIPGQSRGKRLFTEPVAFGSKVTLKSVGYGGGLLHSHQQVTCYHYKDNNNEWNILPRWDDPAHGPTTRNLHSHTVPAPVTKLNHEVSCYGNSSIGDIHDYWVVEVVDDIKRGGREHVDKIHSLTTRLRFRHQVLGCYLRAANAVLPQWGFKQIEVSCIPENSPKDTHTYWNVESHWNDRLPVGDTKFYRSPFLRDFWHLNVAYDDEDILASKPFDWPFLHLGLRMCGWGDTQIKYYLMGNPVIWMGSTISLFVAFVALGIYLLRWQRKYLDMDPSTPHFLYVGKVSFFGWALHYVPFLIMHRVTYLHHYLPTLYFAVLMTAHLLDHFIFSARRLTLRTKWIAFGICAGSVLFCFWWFKAVAFGIDGPITEHKGLLWRKSWNIYTQ
ncbi:glycosyltransferase family 39 protein [Mycena rebaudengoi]|nr:glycosyltransferase family 39 protein [Mycena rebaudengoi]